jgi:iron complex outermembrane receptor protein
MTAIGADQIARGMISDVRELQFAAPSLNLQSAAGDRSAIIAAIRGLAVSDSLVTLDPSVGFYLNGVYVARAPGTNSGLVDIQRVEVLRGPQGTLFGRNTIGGAINVVPREPTDEFQGSLWGSLGNYDMFRAGAVLNTPLSTTVAARIAFQHNEHGGYGRDTLLNRPLSDENSNFARLSVRTRNGPLTALVVGDWSDFYGGPTFSRLIHANTNCNLASSQGPCIPALTGHPTDALTNYLGPPFFTNQAELPGKFSAKTRGVSGVLTYDLGDATLKSITAYRKLHRTVGGYDNDGTPYIILETLLNDEHQKQVSQEFQAYGKSIGARLDWIFGAYFFDEHGQDFSFTRALLPITTVFPSSSNGRVINKSYAAYGQFTYEVADGVKATAGLRYTKDERTLISANKNGGICTVDARLLDQPGICKATLSRDFKYWPWTVGLDWTPAPDLLVYGKVSRGFRAGGFNLRGTTSSSLDPFGPERATSYEAGVKGGFLQRRLRINAAVYNTHYDDIQISTRIASGSLVVNRTENAGQARIRGGELEITALPTPDLRFSASGSYTDPKYTRIGPGASVKLSSKFFSYSKYTYSVALDYDRDLDIGRANLHVDWNWRSEIFNSQVATGVTPAYGLLSATASITPNWNDNLKLSIWGRNINDKQYYNRIIDLSQAVHGIANAEPGEPRTYGISATYEF